MLVDLTSGVAAMNPRVYPGRVVIQAEDSLAAEGIVRVNNKELRGEVQTVRDLGAARTMLWKIDARTLGAATLEDTSRQEYVIQAFSGSLFVGTDGRDRPGRLTAAITLAREPQGWELRVRAREDKPGAHYGLEVSFPLLDFDPFWTEQARVEEVVRVPRYERLICLED